MAEPGEIASWTTNPNDRYVYTKPKLDTSGNVAATLDPSTYSGVQPSAGGAQPAANLNGVMYGTLNPVGGGGTSGGGSTSSNTYSSGPTAAQIAAQQAAAEEARRKAEEEAKRNALRGGIQSLIKNTLGVYDSLFGDVRGAAKSQREQLDQRFDRETGALTDQFNQELPQIGRAYAGRGAYDSSYRIGAENQALQGFEGQVENLGLQRQDDAAKIGQALSEEEAKFRESQNLLRTQQSRLGEVEDIDELTQLRNQMDTRIAELRASRAGNQSRESYLNRFQDIAPAADRLGGLQEQLTTLIQGQAPGPLKRAVAQQIIGSAGLPKEDEEQLVAQVNSQIA